MKIVKPTSPGRRQMTIADFKEITKFKPEKGLISSKQRICGRNNQGKITIRHRGGGNKRFYRLIDFKQRDKFGIPARVLAIEYDPNRTAYIALLAYSDGEKRYILAPEGLKVGDQVLSKDKTKIKTGNRMQIQYIPTGYSIHNIELMPGRGGAFVRSAGSGARIIAVEGDFAHIELPSSEVRMIPKICYASIGVVSNIEHFNIVLGKAGRIRNMGRRPHVRGKAMSPRDHPHGGGEGGCPIGLKHPKTPWGKPALGVKTRRRKKYSDKWIISRRRK